MDWSFFRFVTIHAFDRQTDRQTERQTDRILIARPRLHSMQRGKKLHGCSRMPCCGGIQVAAGPISAVHSDGMPAHQQRWWALLTLVLPTPTSTSSRGPPLDWASEVHLSLDRESSAVYRALWGAWTWTSNRLLLLWTSAEVKSSKFGTTKDTLRSHIDLSNSFWSQSTEMSRILPIKRAQYYTRPSV